MKETLKKQPTAVPSTPFVLEAAKQREKLNAIMEKLEQGVKGLFESEQYKTYLNTLSKFHNYSSNNCLLIALQMPSATLVAGFYTWQSKFKRSVNKGAKGIKIIAPSPVKVKKLVDKLDEKGNPVTDSNGKRVKEEEEVSVSSYRIATVFDISQTNGNPLPQIGVNELIETVNGYKKLFTSIEKTSPVPVDFELISTGAKGYYSITEKRIAINKGMSELQNLKTLIHEVAHARIHDRDKNNSKDNPQQNRRTREVEAESVAYTVCQHFGLDTSRYSFGYIASWSGNKQLDTLKASLETIRKEADEIITIANKHLSQAIQNKEHAATLPVQPYR